MVRIQSNRGILRLRNKAQYGYFMEDVVNVLGISKPKKPHVENQTAVICSLQA